MKFPNESKIYRSARNRVLAAEKALRKKAEAVAALRRKLPQGGQVPEDYVFDEVGRRTRLSELFVHGDTLIAYSYMYGPKMAAPCPMCTSMLDALEGNAQHIAQRTNLVVIAKSPIARILEFTQRRGWRRLRLLERARCHARGPRQGLASEARLRQLTSRRTRCTPKHAFCSPPAWTWMRARKPCSTRSTTPSTCPRS
jgi:predicted dithiol-disulfide oxidoreductase (DUF899 family)